MGSLLQYILKTPIVTESLKSDQPTAMETLAQQIDSRARRRFGRSLQIRQLDAGSCNGCELEIGALNNPYAFRPGLRLERSRSDFLFLRRFEMRPWEWANHAVQARREKHEANGLLSNKRAYAAKY
jgi:hypothetical protein